MNKLAALKEIGAIEYRCADTTLTPALRRDIIARNVANLICDLTTKPEHVAKFGGILERLAARHTTDSEILAGCALLRSMIPLTIGGICAGQTVRLIDGRVVTKRKDCLEVSCGIKIEHLPPDTRVCLL